MARVVSEFPNRVRTIENLWIPLPSGERLAARAWLPDGAETKPVPAILEAIPYRRRDFTRGRDEPLHAYVAGHGYACIRLDIRGSGDSDGVIADEYSEDELADIEHVIAWLAAQPWCSGAIGMMGISWGGINSLQVAARRPTALKAIISLCSTDDRYGGDAHYMGGCLLNENFAWGSVFFIHGALPPDPQVVGERWRAMWLERLNAVPLYPALWMAHQRRDSFWIRGSVCVDYQRINCPVLAIGGWADAYTNTVPRLLSGLRGARKGIIGPWGHAFPHEGTPEPAIGFLQEALRWWDHWLKDIDNGVEKDPILTAWMPDAQSPSTTLRNGTGRWIYERNWPPETTDRRYHFTASGLELDAAPSPAITVRSPVWTGHAGGAWCAFGARGEMPGDQRSDDAGSAVFDTRPLPDPVEVLGAPTLILEVAADQPVAMMAVRLCDVGPSGAAVRVSYGLLNLTHRNGHERPEVLPAGGRLQVRLPLKYMAYSFPAGHRIRVAISTNYWPIAWPAAQPATLSLFPGRGHIDLPVRRDDGRRPEGGLMTEALQAPASDEIVLQEGRYRRHLTHDLAKGDWTMETGAVGIDPKRPRTRIPAIDLDAGHTVNYRLTVNENDPAQTRVEMDQSIVLARARWYTRVEARTRLSSDRTSFHFEASLTAFEEGERLIVSRNWNEVIPRDHL